MGEILRSSAMQQTNSSQEEERPVPYSPQGDLYGQADQKIQSLCSVYGLWIRWKVLKGKKRTTERPTTRDLSRNPHSRLSELFGLLSPITTIVPVGIVLGRPSCKKAPPCVSTSGLRYKLSSSCEPLRKTLPFCTMIVSPGVAMTRLIYNLSSSTGE